MVGFMRPGGLRRVQQFGFWPTVGMVVIVACKQPPDWGGGGERPMRGAGRRSLALATGNQHYISHLLPRLAGGRSWVNEGAQRGSNAPRGSPTGN